MTRSALFGLVLLAATPAALLAGQDVVIMQERRAFSMKEVRVAAGATVRFENRDSFLHQIYIAAASFRFNSPEQEPGTQVAVRFPIRGTFDVRCEIHPRMALAVTVE